LIKALLISVGGSEAPIVHSIEQQEPEYVIYLVSSDSRLKVREDIEPVLKHKPKDHHIITTPNEQDLVGTVRILLADLPGILSVWGLEYKDIVGDFTGGTKCMSAALVLVLSVKGGLFSYIGGKTRNKNGLGVVKNGSEQMLHLQNPWDVLAIDDLTQASRLFNSHQFLALTELANQASVRVEKLKPFFKALEHTALGYYLWDNFQYQDAYADLRRAENEFISFASVGMCQWK